MIEIRQTDTFSDWLSGLRDRQARVRIQIRIDRLALGNPGDVKPVAKSVSELRISYGPGYRVYYVQARVDHDNPACWRRQKHAKQRHKAGVVAGGRGIKDGYR